MDSATRTPLQNVSVTAKNGPKGSLTNAIGKFSISVAGNTGKLTFTTVGYHSLTLAITGNPAQEMTVLLSKSYTELEDVVVNAKRRKYRNKNNPAVDLIRKVIANKSKNGPGAYPFSSYEQYEKIQGLVNQSFGAITKASPLKQFRFFFENVDTTMEPGKILTPVYLQEVLSHNYYRRQPEKSRQVILGRKTVDLGEYIDTKGLGIALNRMYEDINIYDNTVSAFTMQFVSPVAELAPTFYMYFIRDTIVENGVKLVNLYFTPRNPEDLLLQGTLTITLDENYAIRKVAFGVTRHTNLNYVRDFRVKQNFEKGPEDRYHLATSDMVAHFSPFLKSPGIYAERTVTISRFSDTVLPAAAFFGPSVNTSQLIAQPSAAFWDEGRPVPLSGPESKTYTYADSLVKMKSYKRLMNGLTLLSIGYLSVGKVDIGQVGNFYSFNPVEGSKFLFGGRTNTKLSTRYFFDSYVAYGVKDEQWKYYLSGTYSLNHKSIYAYPFDYIQASYLHDTKNPGQEGIFSQGNGLLSSFTRGYNSNWLYNDILRLSYVREFGNHLSYILGFKYWNQRPAEPLFYVYEPIAGQFDTARNLVAAELSVALRWAPHEQFLQNKVARTDIINKYPIITLQYAKGISGLTGGQYSYDALHLNVYKRCYLAPFGYSDVTFDAEYLLGNLPFPLLIIPPVNQSYFYSALAYNLMNSEEFVSDHKVSLNIDHFFNGFFFNKIPLLKKLRLREVIGVKALYGGLRNENNPTDNPEQMKFPLTKGVQAIYTLDNGPYVEGSVGVYNIFSFLRVDLVKRFTYLNHPNISKIGVRFSTNFNF